MADQTSRLTPVTQAYYGPCRVRWHRQYEDDTAHARLRRLIIDTARCL